MDRARARYEGLARTDEETWTDAEGSAAVWNITPRVLVVYMARHAGADIGRKIGASVDRHLAAAQRTYVFYDLYDLETYATETRQSSTDALLKHRPRLVSIHAVTRSRIVRMGISVANMILGIITAHADEPAYLAALHKALAEK